MKKNNIVEFVQKIDDAQTSKFVAKEVEHKDNSGNALWTKSVLMPLLNSDSQKIGEVVVQSDITEQKEFEKLAVTDGLTKLYNRRFFNETLEREHKRAKRDKSCLSFLMLDVDYFKQYNDSYGHSLGDEVLINIAESMQKSLNRAGDFAFRLGGEEFGVLFNGCTIANSLKMAETIRKNIENLNIAHSNSKVSDKVTVSVGVLSVDFSEESVDEHGFYTMADDALYQAKEQGRNRVVLYENEEILFF